MTLDKAGVTRVLEGYVHLWNREQWVILVNNKHIFIGKVKTYTTYGRARGKLVDLFRPYIATQKRDDIVKIIDELIESKVIEIKQIL